jgi:hypothetical protein
MVHIKWAQHRRITRRIQSHERQKHTTMGFMGGLEGIRPYRCQQQAEIRKILLKKRMETGIGCQQGDG